MTRSRARSIVATLLNSRTFAVVSRRKVRLDLSPNHGFGADRTFTIHAPQSGASSG